jgi:dihydrofolate reductase
MQISLITAMTEAGVIGLEGKLPWHIPEELQYFKAMTLNKPIVMGRKTFESMGKRPLPNRINIILTHDASFEATGCTVVHSVEALLEQFKEQEEIMIIGGGEIYKQFLPLASQLYITLIHEEYKGDTYFPPIEWSHWALKEEHLGALFTTQLYIRK